MLWEGFPEGNTWPRGEVWRALVSKVARCSAVIKSRRYHREVPVLKARQKLVCCSQGMVDLECLRSKAEEVNSWTPWTIWCFPPANACRLFSFWSWRCCPSFFPVLGTVLLCFAADSPCAKSSAGIILVLFGYSDSLQSWCWYCWVGFWGAEELMKWCLAV